MNIYIFSIIACTLLSQQECGFPAEGLGIDKFPYDLDHPSATFELPPVLQEISGLSIAADPRYLVCIQDELGAAYWLDKSDAKIVQEASFGKEGDFEAVEMVGEELYAVKSSGTIYRVQRGSQDELSIEKYKTELTKSNNIEGLAYDASGRRLLIACKGSAGIGVSVGAVRAVYAFDLVKKQLLPQPVMLISLDDIRQFLAASPTLHRREKLMEMFAGDREEFAFAPSGISIHPKTGEIYILSSVGKLLMVVSPGGKILNIVKLEKEIHPQPEGICFDTNGALYISNEGRSGPALLHRFDPK